MRWIFPLKGKYLLYFSEKSKQNEDNVDTPVFKCDICKKNFSHQGNLTRHIKNIHGNADDDKEQFLKKGKNHEDNVTRCNNWPDQKFIYLGDFPSRTSLF